MDGGKTVNVQILVYVIIIYKYLGVDLFLVDNHVAHYGIHAEVKICEVQVPSVRCVR